MDTQVAIPGVGIFDAEYDDDVPCNYSLNRVVDRFPVRYFIYPKPSGADYSIEERQELADRIARFDSRRASAISAGIGLIRDLCELYGEPLDRWSDAEVAAAVRPSNAKFEPDGWQESYCDFGLVHPHLDLVLRFDPSMTLCDACFDG